MKSNYENKIRQPHKLYIAVLQNENELFCKIGETKYTVEQRFQQETSYNLKDFVEFEVENDIIAKGIETKILQEIIRKKNKLYRPLKHLNGYYECFETSLFSEVVKYIINNFNYEYRLKEQEKNEVYHYTTAANFFKDSEVTTMEDVLDFFFTQNLTIC